MDLIRRSVKGKGQLRRPRTGMAMHVPGPGSQSGDDGVLRGVFASCWVEADASE